MIRKQYGSQNPTPPFPQSISVLKYSYNNNNDIYIEDSNQCFCIIVPQVYPEDGLGEVVRNVFDFDSYHSDVQKTVVSTIRKHGIPIAVTTRDVKLTKE